MCRHAPETAFFDSWATWLVSPRTATKALGCSIPLTVAVDCHEDSGQQETEP